MTSQGNFQISLGGKKKKFPWDFKYKAISNINALSKGMSML